MQKVPATLALVAGLAFVVPTRASPISLESPTDAFLGAREDASEVNGGLVWGLELSEYGGKLSTWGLSPNEVERLVKEHFESSNVSDRSNKQQQQMACHWRGLGCQCVQDPSTSALNCLWEPDAAIEDLQYDCVWSHSRDDETDAEDNRAPGTSRESDTKWSALHDFKNGLNDTYVNEGTFYNLTITQAAALMRSNYIEPGRVHVGLGNGLVFNLADSRESDFGVVDTALSQVASSVFSGFQEFGCGSQVVCPGVSLTEGTVNVRENDEGYVFEYVPQDDEKTTNSLSPRSNDSELDLDSELDPDAEVQASYTCRWNGEQTLQCKTAGRSVMLEQSF